ncbi:hypothetical protein ES705_37851 [subsurface metagenome]
MFKLNNQWSLQDEQYLIKNYNKHPKKYIAKKLHRSIKSICMKYFHLNKETIPENYPILDLSETEKAYIAGIIDGEGYISFQIFWKNSKPHRATPVLSIANKNKDLITWLKTKISFGNQWKSSMLINSQTDTRYGKMATYYHIGMLNKLKVKPLLLAIKPYIIVKKIQIECILKFFDHHRRWSAYDNIDWKLIYNCIKANDTHRTSKKQSPEKLKNYLRF